MQCVRANYSDRASDTRVSDPTRAFVTDLNPQARQMADESMVRNLAAQARAIWPQEVPMLRRYALPAEPRILDAGCGTGEAASRLAQLFPQARVLGVDIIDQHLEVARSRYARLDRQRSRPPRLRGVDGARGKRAGGLGRIDRSRWRSHMSKH